jgi:hypothetical protein
MVAGRFPTQSRFPANRKIATQNHRFIRVPSAGIEPAAKRLEDLSRVRALPIFLGVFHPALPRHAQFMPNSGTLLPVRSTCLGIQISTIYPQNWETITTAKARGLTSPIWTHSQSSLSLIALTVSPAAAPPVMATDATTADHLLATVLAPRQQLTQ